MLLLFQEVIYMWFDKLKMMKKSCGKTSQQISDETGVPKSTIDKLFSGKTKEPYLSSTKLIVHSMGYTLDDLDDEIEKPTIYNVDEQKLINNFRQLNSKGKVRMLEYSDDLVQSGNYIENEQKEKRA